MSPRRTCVMSLALAGVVCVSSAAFVVPVMAQADSGAKAKQPATRPASPASKPAPATKPAPKAAANPDDSPEATGAPMD